MAFSALYLAAMMMHRVLADDGPETDIDEDVVETSKELGFDVFAGLISSAVLLCVGYAYHQCCKRKTESRAEQERHFQHRLTVMVQEETQRQFIQQRSARDSAAIAGGGDDGRIGGHTMGETMGKARSARRVRHLRSKAPAPLVIDIGRPQSRRMPVEILRNTFFQIERAAFAQLRPWITHSCGSAPRFP